MLGNRTGFPEIGVFLLITPDNQNFYLLSENGKGALPFEKLRGGSSWEESLKALKRRLGVFDEQTHLISLGFTESWGPQGLVFSVFVLRAKPAQEQRFLKIDWGQSILNRVEPLSVDIIKKYLKSPNQLQIN